MKKFVKWGAIVQLTEICLISGDFASPYKCGSHTICRAAYLLLYL